MPREVPVKVRAAERGKVSFLQEFFPWWINHTFSDVWAVQGHTHTLTQEPMHSRMVGEKEDVNQEGTRRKVNTLKHIASYSQETNNNKKLK